jgi:hypothetical protein
MGNPTFYNDAVSGIGLPTVAPASRKTGKFAVFGLGQRTTADGLRQSQLPGS